MIFSGWKSAGGGGLAAGIVLTLAAIGAWVAGLNDYRGKPRDALDAVRLVLRGYDAPAPSDTIRIVRARRREAATAQAAGAPNVVGDTP